jgi:hypothetical protein
VLKSIELGIGSEAHQVEPFPMNTIWILSGSVPPDAVEGNKQNSLLIVGPNVEFHELDKRLLEKKFKTVRYIVPSKWVVPVLSQRLDTSESNVLVWPSGVNLKRWNPSGAKSNHVLVYLKGTEDERSNAVIQYLQSASIKYSVVKYGEYSQRYFLNLLKKTKFAIWIGGTESQGIAIMECWAMNVPTFVFRKDYYFDSMTQQNFKASAAPYLNEYSGRFSNSEEFNPIELERFISDLDSFKPRHYIVANFGADRAIKDLRDQLFT